MNGIKTQCKIEFTYAPHCVCKTVTPRRMLKKCFLIAKIKRWNNSFQNMYDMLSAKVYCLAGPIYFVKKKRKTPKIMDNYSERLTLEGAGAKPRTPGQLLGYP